MNVQRQVIYEQRRRVLEGEDMSEDIRDWIDDLIESVVLQHTQSDYDEEWDLDGLFNEMRSIYDPELDSAEFEVAGRPREELVEEFQDDARDAYTAKEEEFGPELMREIERFLVLQVVDLRWREHLEAMEYLREGIHLRAMAQKDPLVEYRGEGHRMFEELSAQIREEVLRYLFHVEIERNEAEQLAPAAGPNGGGLVYEHEQMAGSEVIQAAGSGQMAAAAMAGVSTAPAVGATSVVTQRTTSEYDRVGRNDPCPCGSGKKYKRCHGA